MVHVSLTNETLQQLSRSVIKKWGFQENQQQQWIADMPQDAFEQFLKECNCIVYKNQIKNYQHGTIYGDFSVS